MTITPTVGLKAARRRPEAPRPVMCQICTALTVPGLDLGHQPVADLLLTPAELHGPETFYPLQLHHCPACGLTQLGYIVSPRIMYRHFAFLSGATHTATRQLQSLPQDLVALLGLDERSFAIDIGSNDGTLLKAYQPYGVRFLGVDPAADPVRIAIEHGIDSLHAFFDERTARAILHERGQANAITACGVFGHIADLVGLMRGVKLLLAEGGVFVTDSQYWLDTVERLHYDNIFHEHLRYYSMKPLIELFGRYDMDVFDVERSEFHGGSIRVYSCHTGERAIRSSVGELLELEERAGLYREETWRQFADSVAERRRRLYGTVHDLVRAGNKVIGIGAPAKAATVTNYCRIGPDVVAYLTEVNPLRIGKYLPGAHIPIVDEEYMFTDRQPADAAILFSWNYYDEIVPKLRARGFEGELVEP